MTRIVENSPNLPNPPTDPRKLPHWALAVTRDLKTLLARMSEAINDAWHFNGFATPPQITADQNDYDPTPINGWRLSADATRTITGIARGGPGRRIIIFNVGAQIIKFANENTSSLPENRIITGEAATVNVDTNDSMELTYDEVSERWRVTNTG